MADDNRRDVGDALFKEGFATALSGIDSDASDGVLCSVGWRTTWQGEPVEAWASRYAEALPSSWARILATLSSERDEDYAALFIGGCDASDLPSRAGYSVGLRVIRALAESASWPEIVR